MKKTKIKIKGTGNTLVIRDLTQLTDCNITITGNNNIFEIGEKVFLNKADLYCEDNNNKIIIGNKTAIYGETHLAAIESTSIIIGEDCMFSSEIHFRTGDSHSIVNSDGLRINPSADITIGNHVWVGTKVLVLKGTNVPKDCIIGAGSLLCKNYDEPNSVIAGSPASVLKKDVNWLHERI